MNRETKELVAIADAFQKDANALLEISGLVQLLSSFGKVYKTGSYRYHLMFVPDIDLYVINPTAGKHQAWRILNKLIAQGFWNAFLFGDWVQFRHKGFPEGFYVGLKRTFRRKRWKIDIWNLPTVPQELLHYDQWVIDNLSIDKKLLILEIKRWREFSGRQVPSKLIYDLILSGKANSLESFKALLQSEVQETSLGQVDYG